MMLTVFAVTLALLPTDRLAMADRLFNRGLYAEAAAEYRLLEGESTIAADELLFRIAECARARQDQTEALQRARKLMTEHPDSVHAPWARLQVALAEQGEERARLLLMLDSDRTPTEIRSAALYHLGVERNDPALLARAVSTAPKGLYADHARLRRGVLLLASSDAAIRKQGMENLLSVAFGKSPLAEEALYLVAEQCYREKRYGESGGLLRRYLTKYPKGTHLNAARTLAIWCDYLQGRYADVAAAVESGASDDFAYLKAACTQAQGEEKSATALFRKYLDDYPQGVYRADAELALARLEFSLAAASGDVKRSLEAARRVFASSKAAADGLRLGWACEQAGRTNEAENVYAQLVAGNPGTAEAASALYARGLLFVRAGNWSKAELMLSDALSSGKLDKRTAMAWYWKGIAALQLEHEAEGRSALQEALKCGLELDENREARLMIAACDLRAGRTAEAKAAYEKLVSEGAVTRMSAQRLHAVARLTGGDTARACADQLIQMGTPEWRQVGFALRGAVAEQRGDSIAAIADYRHALAEQVVTEEAAPAALRLGILESRAGEFVAAEATLKTAVRLTASSARARAEAYVALAKNAEARKDFVAARGYATVVGALFDDAELTAVAEQILKAHPEGADK